MTHTVTNISIHRYQALLLWIAYTLLVITFDRAYPGNPVFEAVAVVGFVLTLGYLLHKLVLRCTAEERHARTKHAAEVVS